MRTACIASLSTYRFFRSFSSSTPIFSKDEVILRMLSRCERVYCEIRSRLSTNNAIHTRLFSVCSNLIGQLTLYPVERWILSRAAVTKSNNCELICNSCTNQFAIFFRKSKIAKSLNVNIEISIMIIEISIFTFCDSLRTKWFSNLHIILLKYTCDCYDLHIVSLRNLSNNPKNRDCIYRALPAFNVFCSGGGRSGPTPTSNIKPAVIYVSASVHNAVCIKRYRHVSTRADSYVSLPSALVL